MQKDEPDVYEKDNQVDAKHGNTVTQSRKTAPVKLRMHETLQQEQQISSTHCCVQTVCSFGNICNGLA